MLSALSSRAIKGEFYNVLSQSTGVPWVEEISMLFLSDQAIETYEQLGMVSSMEEWKSGKNAKMLDMLGNITIINKLFESTIQVSKAEKRRDKTGQIQIRINELVRKAQSHWAKILTELLITGQTTLCQDGQFFFDTDHTEGNNTTSQDNDLTTNIVTAAAPTAAEMMTAILDCISAIVGFKDNENDPMNENANMFRVMVPVNMMTAAAAAVKSPVITDGSGAFTNTIHSMGDFLIQFSVNARLTTTTEFYTFRADGNGTKALIRQEETPLEMNSLAEGSDEEFKNKRHLHNVESSRNVGFGMWQNACLMTFT
jgi:phage major head subunit gpT-like protein